MTSKHEPEFEQQDDETETRELSEEELDDVAGGYCVAMDQPDGGAAA